MGKRRLRFDVRKNNENIKLTVHIPLERIKPFMVSPPLSSYTDARVTKGQTLCARLRTWNQISPHWSEATIVTTPAVTATDRPARSLYTVKCMRPPFSAEVTFTVIIHYDQTWTLTLGSLPVPLFRIPAAPIRLLSSSEVLSLLATLDSLKLCIGFQMYSHENTLTSTSCRCYTQLRSKVKQAKRTRTSAYDHSSRRLSQKLKNSLISGTIQSWDQKLQQNRDPEGRVKPKYIVEATHKLHLAEKVLKHEWKLDTAVLTLHISTTTNNLHNTLIAYCPVLCH